MRNVFLANILFKYHSLCAIYNNLKTNIHLSWDEHILIYDTEWVRSKRIFLLEIEC